MVGAIRVAPVAAAVLVTELSGIAVAGNPAAIALVKNAKRPQFTGRNQDWVFFKRIGASMCDSWVEKLQLEKKI